MRFYIKCDYGYFSGPELSYWAPSWQSGWKNRSCPYVCFSTLESAKESLKKFGTDWPNLMITDEKGNQIP